MATLKLRSVKKSYANVDVLHEISLDIKDGEFVVVVGPSGCGKSTFLRLLAGLEEVSSGEILLNDIEINDLPAKSRDMAMVFQNYALYPHMSVFQNIAYGLKIRGYKKSEICERVNQAADMLALSPYLKRKPGQLSGGQRQRVAMGRALVRRPLVFLFDEPLSNLDAKLRVDTRLKIHKLQRKLGVTSVYVTHDQIEAMTLADTLVVLNNGYAEHVGSPLDIYERPLTKFVAGFIGSPSMNFLDVNLDPQDLILPGREHISFPGLVKNEQNVCLGIRPEHLFLENIEACEIKLVARVDMIEALGHESIIFVKIVSSNVDFSCRVSGLPMLNEGQEVTLGANLKHVHLFDESGRRLDATATE